MLKSKYILCDFIATVPVCSQTDSLAVVLEIFSQGKSDRVVVLDRQQYPLGVLSLRRLMPQMMQLSKNNISFQPPNSKEIDIELIEPVEILPAKLSVEQFQSYTHSPSQQTNTSCESALVDYDGKYLGLLDTSRLWKFLASPVAITSQAENGRNNRVGVPPIARFKTVALKPQWKPLDSIEPNKLDLLVQLLESLPIPLMLQTGTGEVISQNPAWSQQLGALSQPEALTKEVEAILKTQDTSHKTTTGVDRGEWESGRVVGAHLPAPVQESGRVLHPKSRIQNPIPPTPLNKGGSRIQNPLAPLASDDLSHCQLGSQPGTCICVCSGLNGGDRVWQFIKIRLLISVSDQPENEQVWLLLASDITQQQQMASELAAKNADLILLNRLKDEFLACISHELRTPLTAMMGLSTLLKDQAMGKLNERQARYARLIHENGRHLMSVVNDILDVTRIETGQLELTLEPVKIRKVCDRAIEQARVATTPKTAAPTEGETNNSTEHRFSLLIEPGLESIVADELRLRQMLVHLLANAFKFTQLAGEIGLRVSSWAGWIAFTVWDTGIGIPEHQQHLIFQKFQQLEKTLTRQFEGTGLGLVLTRTLARLHGGDVSFLSQEGKGSQFTLLLPPIPPKRAGEAGEAGEAGGEKEWESGRGAPSSARTGEWESGRVKFPPSPLAPRPSPLTSSHLVLLVEAAPQFIEDLAHPLTSLGYWVVIARSGTEALEKARRLQPGAIFINPLLPLLSGWDVLTLLKSDPLTNHIPVIVTTTHAQKDQAFSNRADEFLSLPVKPIVLQKLMTRFCAPSDSRMLSRTCSDNHPRQLTVLRLSQSPQPPQQVRSKPVCDDEQGELRELRELGEIKFIPNTYDHTSPLDSFFDPFKSGLDNTEQVSGEKTQNPLKTDDGSQEVNRLFTLNYRILEADDLEQAALLARIWQPDVVLLDGAILDPPAYLQQLVQHQSLAELPIVTIDAATTQAAKQINQLSVFPYPTTTAQPQMQILSSVLQRAAGINWEYSVLVVDAPLVHIDAGVHTAPPHPQRQFPQRGEPPHRTGSPSHTLKAEWLQALNQYLNTAGYRGVLAHSWQEVQQQIQQHSVDLLLICLGESKQAMSVFVALSELEQKYKLPPIIVMERQFSQSEVKEQFPHYLELDEQDFPTYSNDVSNDTRNRTEDSDYSTSNLVATAESDIDSMEVLGAIATKILPSCVSMEELLDNICQVFKEGVRGEG